MRGRNRECLACGFVFLSGVLLGMSARWLVETTLGPMAFGAGPIFVAFMYWKIRGVN